MYQKMEKELLEQKQREIQRKNAPQPYGFDRKNVNYVESKYSDIEIDGHTLGIKVQIVSDMNIDRKNKF